jgi:hypothetical protein
MDAAIVVHLFAGMEPQSTGDPGPRRGSPESEVAASPIETDLREANQGATGGIGFDFGKRYRWRAIGPRTGYWDGSNKENWI